MIGNGASVWKPGTPPEPSRPREPVLVPPAIERMLHRVMHPDEIRQREAERLIVRPSNRA